MPAVLPETAKDLVRAGAIGHLVTVGRDGAPHVTCVWVAVDGDDLLTAHLDASQQKLANVRRDPRVAVSFESSEVRPPGLREYLVIRGQAMIEEGERRSCSRTSPACTSVRRCASRPWRIRRRE